MMKNEVKAFAPATVANVSCAFDVLGFAVQALGDEVTLRRKKDSGIVISSITGDGGRLSTDPLKNTASVAVQAFLNKVGAADLGVDLQLKKGMPLGSGMGSSAASAAAALYAANAMLGYPLSTRDLVPFAMESERIACGSAHADNAAPALLGGFVLIRSYHPLDIIQIQPPKNLHSVLIHPALELNTSDSRHILKKQVPLNVAVKQWGNIAGLIAGLYTSDYALIGRSLEDFIFEPARSFIIPAFSEVKAAALEAGALGCSISGSGPSLFALSDCPERANDIAHGMQKAFLESGIRSQTFVSLISTAGARLLEVTE
ncbi:MAG: homoserine kinase [Bdellovibrionota bacterium]